MGTSCIPESKWAPFFAKNFYGRSYRLPLYKKNFKLYCTQITDVSNTFIYCSRISIKEGLDIDSDKPCIKDTNRKCSCCKEVFIISKNFEFDDQICNECYNIKSKIDCKSGKVLVSWIDNAFFQLFTNLCSNCTDRIIRSERCLDKFGYINMKKHDSLIELLIAEKSRNNNNDV